MCGVGFAYRPDLESDVLDRTMQRALRRLIHRGPDGKGLVCRSPWAMGHRRLAVIDPAGSRQPMSDPSGRWWLSYNGELYNYAELRKWLAGRWAFTTQGDVEVVLAGLITIGPGFLKRMEGMWAMALWDSQAQELLLVRDRMGKKPLYYQISGMRMACASELRALAPLSWFEWQEDMRSTADYLRYGYYLPGCTAFKNVHELLPGHVLFWSPGKIPTLKAYWELTPGRFRGSRAQAGDLLVEAVTTGVRRRLVADVEVGGFLSGGIDSSLIVGIAQKDLNRPLKTFTIGFDDPALDERRFARRVARRFGTQHHEQQLSIDQGLSLIDPLLKILAQPFGDASIMPTAMVSQMASRHVKVVISGDGGDELFGGYHHYLARSMLRWYTRLPGALRRKAATIMKLFEPDGPLAGLGLGSWVERLRDLLQRMQDESPYIAPVNYHVDDFKQLVPDLWRDGHPGPQMAGTAGSGGLRRMMLSDALVYLPQDILTKVDRASMAFSLEVRSPFLDRQVVELAFALPLHWHRIGGSGKRMLRRSFYEALPQQVWHRRKQGFAVPLNQWFRNGLQNTLNDMLNQIDCPVNKHFVQRMIAAHLDRRCNNGHRLWQLYVYLRWRLTQPWLTS
ncbi:MAG: asparagine synthase (glutamine-hydrolyzing) [Desulfobacteraceae bacterium]|jgi:asparagine synthase (glutamine-hydrolysing)